MAGQKNHMIFITCTQDFIHPFYLAEHPMKASQGGVFAKTVMFLIQRDENALLG